MKRKCVCALKILGLFILLGAVAAGAGGAWLFTHAMPDYSGRATLPGLSASVSVIRDGYGVPHIFAETMDDAARALGYVHAGERLFQMEMQRRAGQGRLAEIIGADMLGVDKYTRTLGLYHLAESSVKALSPETQQFLQAYADGVNTWLDTHRHALPPEFLILGLKPEPWKAADSVVWGKLMSLQLSKNYKSEILRAQLAQKLSPAQMDVLFPPLSDAAPVTTEPVQKAEDRNQESENRCCGWEPQSSLPLAGRDREGGDKLGDLVQNLEHRTKLHPPSPNPSREGRGMGLHPAKTPNSTTSAASELGRITGLDHPASNEWAISGNRTESGKPILANDPHLGLEAPILWYLARIVTPGLSVKGATVPGLPVVLLGQNDHIAWGFTTTGSDVQDLFIETIDPENPANYLTPGGSRPFDVRTETIHVKDAPDVTLNLRATRHGPVMSDIDGKLAELAGEGKVMALAFTALGAHDTTSEALMRLNRAGNWNEFLGALEAYQAPPQNIVYADTEGHIGFVNPGLVPVRKAGNGLVPADGASGASDWTGMIPFAELPQLHDPDGGFIFNANNAVVDARFPRFMSGSWEEPWRAERIRQLFNATDKHTLDTSAAMQADHVSLAARKLLPYLLAQKPADARGIEALAILHGWDGTMDRNRPEPLIFEAWLYEMHRLLLVETTGSQLEEMGPYDATTIATILANDFLGKSQESWCGESNCSALILEALDDALDLLGRRDDYNMKNWRWGKEHTTRLRHKFFSHVPLLRDLTRLDIPSSGDFHTLDRGGGMTNDSDAPFARTHGGGFRGIYDLGNPAQSRFMITTGESGHILSPHYGDLVPLWNEVKSFTLSGTREELKARGLPELVLAPARQ